MVFNDVLGIFSLLFTTVKPWQKLYLVIKCKIFHAFRDLDKHNSQ